VTETQHPLLIAHRAGNHLDALAPAADAGAHLIEIDVWFHRGRLEVGHDKTLGPVPLRWDRWSLGLGWRRKVLLPEILSQLPPHIEPMFDLKGHHPGLPAALLHAIEQHLPNRPYAVSSQTWAYLDHFLHDDHARVVRSVGSTEALQLLREDLDSWPGAGVGFQFKLLTPEVIAELRERTPLIVTWTINDLEQARTLIRQGVGGIITDNLDVIRALREPPAE